MSEMNLTWIFHEECPPPRDVQELLVTGEEIVYCVKTIRDVAVFTNKRLIVRDSQGITGKKVETYSLPYSSIIMFSAETAGTLDLTSEIELWTKAGNIKINLKRKANVARINQVISEFLLKN